MRQAVSLLFGLVVSIPLLFGESNEMRSIDPQENKLLSKLSEKELRGLFRKKSKEDALGGLFGKEKYEVITNLDLNGDGKGENLYGQRYEIQFGGSGFHKEIFFLRKLICFEEGAITGFRVLFLANEDRFLTRENNIFSFDPVRYKDRSFLRWWFLAFYPFLRKENVFLMDMHRIESREDAKRAGGAGGFNASALRWNPKTEDFEVDEELSKKYGY